MTSTFLPDEPAAVMTDPREEICIKNITRVAGFNLIDRVPRFGPVRLLTDDIDLP